MWAEIVLPTNMNKKNVAYLCGQKSVAYISGQKICVSPVCNAKTII